MLAPAIDQFAQLAVERVLNSLPEGILIALGAALLLRLWVRDNPGTRFAVWLAALGAVIALPFLRFGVAIQPALTLHHSFAIVLSPFWASLLLVLWIGVAGLALSRLALGLLRIRQIRRSSTEVGPAALAPELRALFDECGHPVHLLVSDQVRIPAAIGFHKPAVVLPSWILREFSPSELHPILIHELAHLRRYDGWTNLFQKAARALFFFHPAVWWIDARLSVEREMACDDAVLAATVAPDAYAGSLIGLLEKNCAQRGWTMAQAAVSRAREASERITRILSTRGPATTRIALPVLVLAAGFFLTCGGLTLAAPRLLTFAPPAEAAAAVLPPSLSEKNVDASTSGVVLAAYHPRQATHAIHNTAAKHTTATSHRSALRSATLHNVRHSVTPVVTVDFVANMPALPSVTPTILIIDTLSGTFIQPAFALSAPDSIPASQPQIQIQTLRYIQQTPAGLITGYVRILVDAPAQPSPNAGRLALAL